ncbi:hypothetical protein EVAR_36444_1 [Eumeta japonica]|uniref:Uncharacterized protein n=1 Tax=Eumeta variegata TaxID=151549 RepID=A0A4C1VNN3_EUMVA|nr:hypothetical protein EVAR_36444_1 [Eumeta japonica]
MLYGGTERFVCESDSHLAGVFFLWNIILKLSAAVLCLPFVADAAVCQGAVLFTGECALIATLGQLLTVLVLILKWSDSVVHSAFKQSDTRNKFFRRLPATCSNTQQATHH